MHPGGLVDLEPCSDPLSRRPCDMATLRRECTQGFAHSCALISRHPGAAVGPDKDSLVARALPLAREGCRARIESDCFTLGMQDLLSDQQLAEDRMCPVVLPRCLGMSNRYRKLGDLTRARDLVEQVCQYERSLAQCLWLGEDYVAGNLAEPVAGRGEALIAWACRDNQMREVAATCKARAAKHTGARAQPGSGSAPSP